jgi:hypothetical protein
MTMQTRSGIPLQRTYNATGGEGEQPGVFPFARGRLSKSQAHTTWIRESFPAKATVDDRTNKFGIF